MMYHTTLEYVNSKVLKKFAVVGLVESDYTVSFLSLSEINRKRERYREKSLYAFKKYCKDPILMLYVFKLVKKLKK